MRTQDSQYRPISDYAIIGDTRTAALVSSDGSIDWACLPHFDNAALFLRLLDKDKGGYCSVIPDDIHSSHRQYLGNSAILETTFKMGSGILSIIDFMPVQSGTTIHRAEKEAAGEEHRIVRIIRCVEGQVKFRIEAKPTFSFATETAAVSAASKRTILFRGRSDLLAVDCDVPWCIEFESAVAEATLRAGERLGLVLTHVAAARDVRPVSDIAPLRWLDETQSYWQEWSKSFRYQGQYAGIVLRSAITLKLLTYSPTGAIVAAPTTSLPEKIGGVRNWDYRYTWLRDSTFTLMALLDLGFFDEAHDFMHFLARLCTGDCTQFRILYSIHGDIQGSETFLEHLAGYMGSKPVRVGNGAATQKQLDVYGELVHAIYLYSRYEAWGRHRESFVEQLWPTVQKVADYVADHWREPDSGIWEMRAAERHFVHSKGMCHVALNCAAMLVRENRRDQSVARWEKERDAIKQWLFSTGYSDEVGAFTQSAGSTILDAAVLRLPMLGVIDANDPRMLSTVNQIEKQLVKNGLVYRYVDRDGGLTGTEGTFAICTFWLIHNYVMQGRITEAEELFQHVLRFANDVGLFAEEIEPDTGAQLGNFPQGFTHLGLINAAIRISAAKSGDPASAHGIVETEKAG